MSVSVRKQYRILNIFYLLPFRRRQEKIFLLSLKPFGKDSKFEAFYKIVFAEGRFDQNLLFIVKFTARKLR